MTARRQAEPRPGSAVADAATRRRVVVCAGAGGVGKTTLSAALGLLLAESGRRAIVLTIDPAQRLAQAMGLDRLDGRPRPVDGVAGLDAMMLDTRRAFDALIERQAPDEERAAEIKANPFYRQLADALSGTQEYMAMEQLHELHQAGRYDCIVVDTPPARSAVDFLDAPQRMTEFLEGRLLKTFLAPTAPGGRLAARAAGLGTGMMLRAAARVTGAAVLDDLGAFFRSFDGMYEGFRQRAAEVDALLRSPAAGFLAVAAPQAPALREARALIDRLGAEGVRAVAVIVNRVTPGPRDLAAVGESEAVRAAAALAGGRPASRAAAGLLRLHADRVRAVEREQQAIATALPGAQIPVTQVPAIAGGISTLDGLRSMAAALAGLWG